jgi:hypothetical protein
MLHLPLTLASCCCSDLTNWLPWFARSTLQSMESSSPEVAAQAVQTAGTIIGVWGLLLSTSLRYSSSSMLVNPAAWFEPSLLQLVHALLKTPKVSSLPKRGAIVIVMANAAAAGFDLEAHPALYKAVTGRSGDVVLGATAAEALGQVSLVTPRTTPVL